MTIKTRLRAVGAVSWPAAIWIAAAAVFFRDFLLSRFDSIAGDSGDARLDIFVRENFYRFLRGAAEFASPPMFYPVKDTLGYSDGYLLDSLVYVPLRMLGTDPFWSFEAVCIALSLVGFISFNVLVVRYGGARQPLAAISAVLFSFSNALFYKIGHPQLLEVNVTPIVAILVFEAARRNGERLSRIAVPGFLGGCILALLFSTGYYVACFFTLILALTLAANLMISNGVRLQGYLAPLRAYWRTGVVFLVGFAVGIIPFVRMYAPILAEHPGRPFSEYLFYAPYLSDIVNVSHFNLVWGSTLNALIARDHLVMGEVALAVTPIVLTTYLVCIFHVWRGRLLAAPQDRGLRTLILGSFVTLAVLWTTTVRVDGFSLFWLEWHLIPGASAIRTGGRFLIIASVVVTAVVAICLARLLDSPALPGRKFAIWALVLLCVAEQVNVKTNHNLSRARQIAFLESISRPPTGCRSFLLATDASKPKIEQQVDAMLIAQRAGVPTLNGYSGWIPTGWTLFEINKHSYQSNAWDWAEDHGITEGLCDYNVATREWRSVSERELLLQSDRDSPTVLGPAVIAGTTLDMRSGGNGIAYQTGSWSEPEPPGTWTDGTRAGLAVPLGNWQGNMKLAVTGRPFLVPARHPKLAIEVGANGTVVDRWSYDVEQDNRPVTRVAHIPAAVLAASPVLRIQFRIDQPASPAATRISSDSRKLGLFVSGISFDPSPD
ncbi:MAG: hypothetical protein ACLP8B_26985 [Xanthobacteraceae bacterium]